MAKKKPTSDRFCGEARDALQAEVEKYVLDAVVKAGTVNLEQAEFVKPFLDRGAGRSTVYRWVGAILTDGRAAQHLARAIKEAAEERAARGADPAASAAADVAKSLPAVVRPRDIAGDGVIPIIEHLNRCVATAMQLMEFARTKEGEVRNAKLLLSASEHLRRNLETATKIADQMREVNQVDRFHVAIMEEIAKESPECAERIQRRLAVLSAEWGG